jgi:hypothetical protein
VAADRGINSHRGAGIAVGFLKPGKLAVNILAHAVEALEFKWDVPGKHLDCTHGVSVMRGECRIDRIGCSEQSGSAGKIGDIGRDFAGKDRKIAISADLAGLDFAVPIGALDQPDHDPAIVPPGQPDDPVSQRNGALLIGLKRQTKALPAGAEQGLIGHQRFDDIHRQFQPLSLFGVNREVDIGIARPGGEILQNW